MLRKNLGLFIFLGVLVILIGYGCNGYNGLVNQDENVNQAWNNVQSDYQRRADLIPNLVNTVKGEANFEKSTLENVIAAIPGKILPSKYSNKAPPPVLT